MIDGRRKLQVDIIDTGMGIAQEKQQIIFDPFVQADNSIAPLFGGTGLGLAISRSLAELLGGTLSVSSQIGTGSTFTLVIDAEQPLVGELNFADAADGGQRRNVPDVAALRGRRVLIVEDNPLNRKLIRLTFERAGAVVETAENGQAGVEKAEQESFDIVLMDMQMPVMDGFTATSRFRQRGYTGPIIALTAHALPEEREKCLAAGCDAFVSKPIDLDHLKMVVAQLISSTAGSGRRLSAQASSPEVSTADDDPDIREVAREFLAWLPDAICQLREAAAQRDYDTLAALSHTLKGSGGTFGYPEVTDIAKRLESASKHRDDLQINAFLGELAAFVVSNAVTSK
jgi:CheY-like chemotaxis protein